MMLTARDNPFSVDRVLQVRYRLLDRSWETLLGDLARHDYRAAIVGRQGAGKSTLLEDLAAPLADRGYAIHWLRLSRERPRFPPGFWRTFFISLGPRDVILFDGAEQLRRLAWLRFRWLSRRAGGVIVTAHRPGLLPTLIDCRTTPELFEQIVAQLAGPAAHRWQPLLDQLFAKHDGDIRLALRELYDLAASESLPV